MRSIYLLERDRLRSEGVLSFMIAITDTAVVTTPHAFEHLTPEQVVVLDGEQGALSLEQEEA